MYVYIDTCMHNTYIHTYIAAYVYIYLFVYIEDLRSEIAKIFARQFRIPFNSYKDFLLNILCVAKTS